MLIANTLRLEWFDGALQDINIFDPLFGDAEWILKIIFIETLWNALILHQLKLLKHMLNLLTVVSKAIVLGYVFQNEVNAFGHILNDVLEFFGFIDL